MWCQSWPPAAGTSARSATSVAQPARVPSRELAATVGNQAFGAILGRAPAACLDSSRSAARGSDDALMARALADVAGERTRSAGGASVTEEEDVTANGTDGTPDGGTGKADGGTDGSAKTDGGTDGGAKTDGGTAAAPCCSVTSGPTYTPVGHRADRERGRPQERAVHVFGDVRHGHGRREAELLLRAPVHQVGQGLPGRQGRPAARRLPLGLLVRLMVRGPRRQRQALRPPLGPAQRPDRGRRRVHDQGRARPGRTATPTPAATPPGRPTPARASSSSSSRSSTRATPTRSRPPARSSRSSGERRGAHGPGAARRPRPPRGDGRHRQRRRRAAVRLWRPGNTWGDDALTFEATTRLVRQADYTRNVPSSVEVPPGGTHELPFDLEDGTWSAAVALGHASGRGLRRP